jgi:hypothetical protein
VSTGNPFPPIPTQTPILDKNAASGVSWPWIQWFLQLNNFFLGIAKSLVQSFAGRTGSVVPQAGDYPPNLGGTGQTSWTKGNLLVGSGVNTTDLLAVGPDGSVFTAISSHADGVDWVMPATAAVSSVFGRTGTVTATAGDYSPANGGTGQTSWVKGNLLVGQAVSVTALLAPGADTNSLVYDATALNGLRYLTYGDAEVPVGVVDGINTIYTLLKAPFPANSLQLFENIGGAGQFNLQVSPTNYTIVGNTITYVVAPIIGTLHKAWYRA